MAWLSEEWNRPDRHDHYLMLVATRVQQVLAKHPSKIKPEHNKLQFGPRKPAKPIDRQTAANIAKAAWVGRMTMPITVKEAGKE